jgi:2-hydroxychromene-2-carboxylate isomerase
VPAKAAYMRKDLADWARAAGLKIVFPPRVFPVNSVKAMRGCLLLEADGKLTAFARAAFEAYWGDDEDISQDDVLARVADRAGVDPVYLFAGLGEQAVKDRLRANTEELMRRRLRLTDHVCRRYRHVLRQRPAGAGARRRRAVAQATGSGIGQPFFSVRAT